MSSFNVLFLAHLVGDFLFQTSWMAENKSSNKFALLIHSSIYTFIIYLAAKLFLDGLSLPAIGLIFFSHIILDKRTLVNWWVSQVMNASEANNPWLRLISDQIFHLLVLAVAIYV